MHDTDKCVRCGTCVSVCPEEAIAPPGKRQVENNHSASDSACCLPDGGATETYTQDISDVRPPQIDRSKCTLCMKCVEVCPQDAITRVSSVMTLDEVFREVKSDEVFYRSSGGGMTLSGGEALLHPGTALSLLKLAKADSIHTVVDTSGFLEWELLERVLPYVDLFLFDVKVMDEKKHIKWTGKSNALIFENARKLAKHKAKLRLRLPVVHDVNFYMPEYAEQTLKFAEELGDVVSGIDVLPYHNFAEKKYDQLGRSYFFKGFPNLYDEDVAEYVEILKGKGNAPWEVTIGGIQKADNADDD
ncbi:glycyl-radical enzyme activating family protein [delta proteobacterium NaphS2]|nr:glycyl-radical enzyme activating family protein [delta proteobacterium NaphS2]